MSAELIKNQFRFSPIPKLTVAHLFSKTRAVTAVTGM